MQRYTTLGSIERFPDCGECSVDCRTRVHDEDVTHLEEVRDAKESRVHDEAVAHSRNHELHFVPSKPSRLGRLMCRELVGQNEIDGA